MRFLSNHGAETTSDTRHLSLQGKRAVDRGLFNLAITTSGNLSSLRYRHLLDRGHECRRIVLRCQYTLGTLRDELRVLGRRFSLRRSHGPVRDVGDHLGSPSDVVGGVRGHKLSLSFPAVRTGVVSVTNIQIVYSFRRSIFFLTGYLGSRSSVRVVARGSCVSRPGPGNCHDLRLAVQLPMFFTRGRVRIPIRVRLHAVTVSF